MAKIQESRGDVLLRTIEACIKNGERLLDETYDLEFRNPPSSRFFLIMIAQEEFAKAFMLYLIKEGTVPLNPLVLRSIRDHTCKQLIGLIMDYIIMHWDDIEELRVTIQRDYELGDDLPDDVGSAIELLRYEKIGRWKRESWDEDPTYDKSTLQIAEGKKDRRKQDALYVRVGRDGQACSTPETIGADETREEQERADRYRYFVNSLLDSDPRSDRYDKAMAALELLFEDLA